MHEWQPGACIRIVVPGPPRALERNRHRIVTPHGKPAFVGTYLPAASRSEQAVMRAFAHKAMNDREPLTGAVDLRFVAFMPIPASWSQRKQADALADRIRPAGKPDIDNLLKMVDSFKEVVWRDDAQITDACLWKRYSDRPRLVIEVRALACVPVASLLGDVAA